MQKSKKTMLYFTSKTGGGHAFTPSTTNLFASNCTLA